MRRWRVAVLLAVAMAASGCGGDDDGIGPPRVITLTSPVGSVMAVGRTVQMSADVSKATGTMLTWNSSNTATATVSGDGLVLAIAAGTTVISASQDEASGSFTMQVVDADLPGIIATLADLLVGELRKGLSASTASTLDGLFTTCSGHFTSGHVGNIDQCLKDLLNTGGAGANDTVLLSVLALFFGHAQRLLQL